MQESTRRQYLSLLGIDTWLPRDEPDARDSALPVATSPAGVVPAGVVPAPVSAPEPAIVPESPAVIASEPADIAVPAPLSFSLLALPDGLLLLAAPVTPEAPGLSGPEHALLASIATALAPGATLPATDEFHWPPRGVKLPAVAASGGATDVLVGLLAEHRRRRGLRDLLVLGEALAAAVQPAAGRLGLNVVAVPALAAMLSDPARKRACWDAAKSLRRGG